jgi:ATP-dependent exoDNAse (exonuclease V) beta subunit
LQQTHFRDFYATEKTRCYLDNLNLLYVALTRAEEGLIVTAPHLEVSSRKNVSQLLFQSIALAYAESKHWNKTDDSLFLGEWTARKVTSESTLFHATTLSHYGSYRWRDQLIIRQTARYLDPTKEEKHQKISYGLYVHMILSRISYAQEIPDALDRLVLEGVINREQRTLMDTQLKDLLTDPKIAGWFSPGWEVRTEVPILVPDGTENRIDRLLLKGKKAIVVDYKTGEPTKADQRQVQQYIGILRKMNFPEVEGYLLYLKDGEVVSVSQGRGKTLNPRNRQQLDLGF